MSEETATHVGYKFHETHEEILQILLNCEAEVGQRLDISAICNEFQAFKPCGCACRQALEDLAAQGWIELTEDSVILTEKGRRHVYGPPEESEAPAKQK
jgi:Mn-dependent DtxR family transcriptional regulator